MRELIELLYLMRLPNVGRRGRLDRSRAGTRHRRAHDYAAGDGGTDSSTLAGCVRVSTCENAWEMNPSSSMM